MHDTMQMHDATPLAASRRRLIGSGLRASARLAVLAAGLSVMAIAVQPASAQEQDITGAILTNLGLAPKDGPEIDYRERAPLVVPPSADMLPAPRDAATVANDPAWPKDADTARREKEKAEAKRRPRTQIDESRADGKALSPSEMAKGHTSPGSTARAPVKPADEQKDWLHPKFLDFTGWGNKKTEPPMVFAGEPERESLTQPPPGYQTPATNAPYGVVEEKKKTWSPSDWFDASQKNKTRN